MKNVRGLRNLLTVFVVFALVVSLCVPTFAAVDGNGIKITNCEVSDADANGLFSVSIDYEIEEGYENEIGVTLLSYAGDSLSENPTTPFDSQTMQIVGVNQFKQTTAKNTIVFKVTTNEGAAVKMSPGGTAIVLLGGDAVTPAAVLFNAPGKSSKVAAKEELADSYGDISTNDYIDDPSDTIIDYLEGKVGDLELTLDLYDDAEAIEPADSLTIDSSWITGVEKESGTYSDSDYNYKASISIPADVAGDEGILTTTEKDVEFYISANWDAQGAIVGDISVEKQDTVDELEDAVVAQLRAAGEIKVTRGAACEADVTNVDDCTIVAECIDEYKPELTEEQDLTFDITIDDVEASNDYGVVSEGPGEGNEARITVTVSALADNEFIISSVEPVDSTGTAIEEDFEFENGTFEKIIIAKISEDVDSATVYNSDELLSEEGWKIGDWSIVGYDSTVPTKQSVYAEAEISAPDVRGDYEGVNKNSIKVKVNITVNAAKVVGDVNGDGLVNDEDWGIIFNHVSYFVEKKGLPSWNDPEVYDPDLFELADVDGNGIINDFEWMIIFNHVSGYIEDPNLPAWE